MPEAPLCEAKATRPGAGSTGAYVAFQVDRRVGGGDAEAVRTHEAHAAGSADRQQLVGVLDLASLRGEHRQRPHVPAPRKRTGRRRNLRAGQGEDRQVDRLL